MLQRRFKVGDKVVLNPKSQYYKESCFYKGEGSYYYQDQIPVNVPSVVTRFRNGYLNKTDYIEDRWSCTIDAACSDPRVDNSYAHCDLILWEDYQEQLVIEAFMEQNVIDLKKSDIEIVELFIGKLRELGFIAYATNYEFNKQALHNRPFLLVAHEGRPNYVHFHDNHYKKTPMELPRDWNLIMSKLSTTEKPLRLKKNTGRSTYAIPHTGITLTNGNVTAGLLYGGALAEGSSSFHADFYVTGRKRDVRAAVINTVNIISDVVFPSVPSRFSYNLPHRFSLNLKDGGLQSTHIISLLRECGIKGQVSGDRILVDGMQSFSIPVEADEKCVTYIVKDDYVFLKTLFSKRKAAMSSKLRAFSIPLEGVNPRIIEAWIKILEGFGYRLQGEVRPNAPFMLINGGNVSGVENSEMTFSYSDVNNKRNAVVDIITEFEKAMSMVSTAGDQAVVSSELLAPGTKVVLHDNQQIEGYDDFKIIEGNKDFAIGSVHVVEHHSLEKNMLLLSGNKFMMCADRFKPVRAGDMKHSLPDGSYVKSKSALGISVTGVIYNGIVFASNGQQFPFLPEYYEKLSPEQTAEYMYANSPFNNGDAVQVTLPNGRTLETTLATAWVIYDEHSIPRLVFSDEDVESQKWFEVEWLSKHSSLTVDGVDLKIKTTCQNNNQLIHVMVGDSWINCNSLLELTKSVR